MTRRLGIFWSRSPVEVHCRIHDSLTGTDFGWIARSVRTQSPAVGIAMPCQRQ